MTSTIYREWLLERYGSTAAIDEAHDDFLVSVNDRQTWSLAVCEEAGIPYSGWTLNALDCARRRLKDNEAERETVRILNDFHNRAPLSALDHWLGHLSGVSVSAYA